MASHLTTAAILLTKREAAKLVAATGLFFEKLKKLFPNNILGDVLISHKGGIWGEEVVPGIGFPILRSTNMRGKRVDVADATWCSVERTKAHDFSLETGDILVTKSSGSSDLVGKAALFVDPEDGNEYLFSNFTLRLRPDSRKVLPEYMAWFLRSPQSLLWRFETQQNAVGLRNLQTREFLGQLIPIPELPVQEQIVNFLNYLETDDLSYKELPLPAYLDVERVIVGRIEGLAERVGEVQRLRNLMDCELSQLIVSLHHAHSRDRIIALGEVLDLYEEKVEICSTDTYPQVGIRAYGQGMFFRESITGAQTTYKNFNKLFDGAIVLSQVKGWEGAVAVCQSDLVGYYGSPEYRTFRCKPGVCSSEYLSVLFATSWFFSKLSTLSRGVGGRRERLRPESFLALRIPMPVFEDQIWLQPIFSRIKKAAAVHVEASAQVDTIMAGILDKAFKGEL